MLITKAVEINLHPIIIKHLEGLGYILEKRPDSRGIMRVPKDTKLIIPVEDLMNSSDYEVLVKCDYCGEIISKQWKKYLSQRKVIKKDACDKCSKKKQEDVMMLKYGVKTPIQTIEFKDKIVKSIIKYKIEDIKKEFEDRNMILLNTEYESYTKHLSYICSAHLDKGIQKITYANFRKNKGCKYCGYDKVADKLKFTYEEVKALFDEKGYTLLSKDYHNKDDKLDYVCRKHPDLIQTVTFANFKHRDVGCRHCKKEERDGKPKYKSILYYIRGNILEWKIQSIKECDYKCILTGLRFQDIHHLYSLRSIVKESTLKYKDKFYLKLDKYSEEELNNIVYDSIILHMNKYGLGVCLNRRIHTLFHKKYLYLNNTKEQFKEFKVRYFNGEFDDELEEELKSYNSIKRSKEYKILKEAM